MAANFLGINLSAFLRMAALERSTEIIKENDNLLLTDKDRDSFLNALEKPLKPNKNLKKAFQVIKN